MPAPGAALPGRTTPIPTPREHFLNHRSPKGPYPAGTETAIFGLGCFWGAERKFWELGEGIHITAVGYAAGHTPNPTYEEVCSGQTGHNEVVIVVYDPAKISYEQLLKAFWENHDPTTLNRQGPDFGSQYRSAIFFHTPEQQQQAIESKRELEAGGLLRRPIVTEIVPAATFYRAEEYHQQYYQKRGITSCGH